jgi:hypothetical protein
VGAGGLAQWRATVLGTRVIGIWPNGPWAIFNGARVGAVQVGRTVAKGRPVQRFLLFTSFPIIPKLRFQKYKSQSYLTPTLFKIGKLVDKFQANKLPFWLNFQFPLDFELNIQETNQISNLLEF